MSEDQKSQNSTTDLIQRAADAICHANAKTCFFRTPQDYAIEFGRYLATVVEQFMAEQNRAWEAEEAPDSEYWRRLEAAIHEFRKRADRAQGNQHGR